MTISIKLNKSETLGHVSTKEFKELKKRLKKRGFTLRKPYQEDGIKWMVKRERSSRPFGLLCDEPGLGKTLQTIATIMMNKKSRTLIAVPTCVLTQWKDILETLIPGQTFLFHGSDRPKRATLLRNILKQKTIVLTTIGLLLNRDDSDTQTTLQKLRWDRLVIDECHFLRNPKTRTFQGAMMIRAPIRWGLTGTPIQNSKRDIKTLFEFIGATTGKLKTLIKFHLLRRTKKQMAEMDDALKLPPLTIIDKKIPLTPLEINTHKVVGDNSQYPIERIIRQTQTEIHPNITLASESWKSKFSHRFLFKPKTSSKITTLIHDIKKFPTDQSLVFCQFVKEIQIIQDALTHAGITNASISGHTSHNNRQTIIQQAKNGIINTLVIQINAASVGLNLQFANRVFIISPSWNPTTELQAIARAHRIGQTKHVFGIRYFSTLPTSTSIDLYKHSIQLNKLNIIKHTLH